MIILDLFSVVFPSRLFLVLVDKTKIGENNQDRMPAEVWSGFNEELQFNQDARENHLRE